MYVGFSSEWLDV